MKDFDDQDFLEVSAKSLTPLCCRKKWVLDYIRSSHKRTSLGSKRVSVTIPSGPDRVKTAVSRVVHESVRSDLLWDIFVI